MKGKRRTQRLAKFAVISLSWIAIAGGASAQDAPAPIPFSNLASPQAQGDWEEKEALGKRLLAQADAIRLDRKDMAAVRKLLDEMQFKPAVALLRQTFAVDIRHEHIGGVPADVITPSAGIAPRNRNRLLINLHGGGMAVGGGYGGQAESIAIAALGGFKVLSVDYRMAPEHRFPAASEDVARVYRALLKTYRPENIGIYGCSSGASLTAQSVAWFQRLGLARPGAIGMFGSGAGATANWGDAFVISKLLAGQPVPKELTIPSPYFEGMNRHDPLIAPVHYPEVLAKFPPSLLITGTRDLGMSVTVYSHAQLIGAGAEADLHVLEGAGHCSFAGGPINPQTPETRHAWNVIVSFFDKQLGRPR